MTTPELRHTDAGLALCSGDLQMVADLGTMKKRIRPEKVHSELLVKAVKIKGMGGETLRVVDATAGLGEDSLLLAAAGFEVQLFEHDPVISALLADALDRAADDPILAPIVARISLTAGDSITAMRTLTQPPHVVYLDPMFPGKTNSAESKKKFQLLHMLEAPCSNEEELLEAALAARPRKIVIKRPLKAPALAGAKPSYSLKGKIIRYDCIVLP